MQSKFAEKLCCVLFSFILAMSSVMTVSAKTTAELKKEKEKIQSEINSAQEKIKNLKSEKSKQEEYVKALMDKVTLLQDKINNLEKAKAALQSEINAIQDKIDKTVAEIDKAQREIDEKQAEFEKIYQQYCQRLRAMYISGNVTTLEILLESGDMSSVLTRAQMVKCVSEQDSETLDSLMKKMQEIEAQKQELERKKLELKEDKTKLDAQKAELQASIDDISASKSELDKEVSECNAAIRKLDNQTAEIQETISANEKEQAAIDEEIRRASYSYSDRDTYVQGTGQLGYPTSSRTISAGYPNYSNGSYHGGIDFRCPVGTAVHASDSGTVSIAKALNYSYGHYILINHGNGISTLYAHNSQLLVSVGQSVTKGQIIAYSGQTGRATGPHVHFEVRVNGNRVNPLAYL